VWLRTVIPITSSTHDEEAAVSLAHCSYILAFCRADSGDHRHLERDTHDREDIFCSPHDPT